MRDDRQLQGGGSERLGHDVHLVPPRQQPLGELVRPVLAAAAMRIQMFNRQSDLHTISQTGWDSGRFHAGVTTGAPCLRSMVCCLASTRRTNRLSWARSLRTPR